MNNVRTVLAKHKAYKRARRLWEEYLEVSELRDKVEADQKLSTFLDNFKQSYEELSSGPRAETMDSIELVRAARHGGCMGVCGGVARPTAARDNIVGNQPRSPAPAKRRREGNIKKGTPQQNGSRWKNVSLVSNTSA